MGLEASCCTQLQLEKVSQQPISELTVTVRN